MEENIIIVPSETELEKQFEFINSLIERHRSSAIALVNTEAMQMNWEIGQYISLQLKTARWGTKVVSDLADYYSTETFAKIISSLQLPLIVQSGIAQLEPSTKSSSN